MKIALLGFAEAGRRTLFELLTGRTVPEGLKTGEAPEGVAPVRDDRVDAIAKIVNPKRKKYAETEFVLCPEVDESQGKRTWVDSAKRADALCLVVRAFQSAEVFHPKGSVDVERDRELLNTELLLGDLEAVDKRLERIGKEKRAGQNALQVLEEKVLVRCQEALQAGTALRDVRIEAHELATVLNLGLLSLKPVMCVYNVDDSEAAAAERDGVFRIACKIEKEISAIEDEGERKEFLSSLGLTSSGLDRMSAAAYDALGLMSFYTMGKDEVRAWTIRKGTAAPQAAGKVHSDMERGFIRAEVIRYDDLMSLGSEAAVKQHGKMALRGKDYIIQDGDICVFLFSV